MDKWHERDNEKGMSKKVKVEETYTVKQRDKRAYTNKKENKSEGNRKIEMNERG